MIVRRRLLLVIAALVLVSAAASGAEEQRVALVIGNAAYAHGALRNPVNDARAIAGRLEKLGFHVIRRENMRSKDIGPTLREFRSRLTPGAVALFFYAGHGLQVRGLNYLPAVDAEIEAEEDVPTQSLEVGKVLEVMEDARTRVNLVFLDACRDNPFARRFRSLSRGLAKVDAASGTLIAFATRPGSVAADGEGSNGLYTEYLLKHMDEADVPIEQMLKRVGAGVKLASKGRQEPWSEGLIEGDFFFRASGGQALAPAPAAQPAPLPQAPQPAPPEPSRPEQALAMLVTRSSGTTAVLDTTPSGMPLLLPSSAPALRKAASGEQMKELALLYRRDADAGNPVAQASLGTMYGEGIGVPRDATQALQWYQKAAAQGSAFAQIRAGVLLESGNGAAKDDATALSLYRNAANGGGFARLYALLALRDMYREGRGVESNFDESAKWAQRAEAAGKESAPPDAEPVRTTSVPANASWVDTGVDVRPGEVIGLKAEGRWSMGVICGTTGPDGRGVGFLCMADYMNIGVTGSTLIGKIGDGETAIFPVGNGTYVRGYQTGRIYLRAYDALPFDNTGSVTVTFVRIPEI